MSLLIRAADDNWASPKVVTVRSEAYSTLTWFFPFYSGHVTLTTCFKLRVSSVSPPRFFKFSHPFYKFVRTRQTVKSSFKVWTSAWRETAVSSFHGMRHESNLVLNEWLPYEIAFTDFWQVAGPRDPFSHSFLQWLECVESFCFESWASLFPFTPLFLGRRAKITETWDWTSYSYTINAPLVVQ